jgi:cell division protein FtsQ
VIVRLAAWLLALGLVLAPVIAVLNGWLAADRWPIERLLLHAPFAQIDEETVRAAALPHLADGFFAIRLERVREAVAALPWVASAEVRKHWPNVVEITVVEHQAQARWGSERLVSERGVLFAPGDPERFAHLPQLDGPDSRLDEVLGMYRDASALLLRHGLEPRSLRLSPRGSWSLLLADGARITAGRGDPLPRLQRFATAMPRLQAAESRRLERADLRYGNGFSLRWHDEPPADAPARTRT